MSVCAENVQLITAELEEQPWTLKQPNGGSSQQPTVLPEWRFISFSDNLTCCSLVHLLGNRARKMDETKRNSGIIRIRPFMMKLRSYLPLEYDYLFHLTTDITKKARLTAQKYSTAWWGVSPL